MSAHDDPDQTPPHGIRAQGFPARVGEPPGGQFVHPHAAEPELARGIGLEGRAGGDRYRTDADDAGPWSVAPPVIDGAESLPSPIPRPPAPKPQVESEPEARKRSLWDRIVRRDP
ncbi:hypothetical protein [Saccharothrix deserti]|uniref:hypothetical protein n=1 Tax=Saccharothrix deserti TaxID=2593674 RepID=UPI00131E5856|nr:hypothetical protein [Saccharothrix deserti]